MQGIVQMFILCVKKAWRNKQISQNNLYEYWLSPCMTTILFCLMNKNQDVRLILAGVSVMILWSVNIFECAYIVIDEKVRGTLGYMLMSPFHTQFILFSEALSTVLFNVPVILVVGIVTYCICPYVLGGNMIVCFIHFVHRYDRCSDRLPFAFYEIGKRDHEYYRVPIFYPERPACPGGKAAWLDRLDFRIAAVDTCF